MGTFLGFRMLAANGKRKHTIPEGTGLPTDGERLDPVRWALDVFLFPEQARHYEVFLVNDSAVLEQIGLSFEGASGGIATPTRSWSPGVTAGASGGRGALEGREGAQPDREPGPRAAAGALRLRPPESDRGDLDDLPRGDPVGPSARAVPRGRGWRPSGAGSRARALADRARVGAVDGARFAGGESSARGARRPRRGRVPRDLRGAVPAASSRQRTRRPRPGAIWATSRCGCRT